MSSEHVNASLARREFIAADAATSLGWLAAGTAAAAGAQLGR